MRIRNFVGVLAVGSIVAASVGFAPQSALSSGPAAAKTDAFNIDPVHTSVIFKIRHMGITNFYGRFNEASGDFTIDAANPTNSKFNVTLKTASVDTNNKDRDAHLKNPDFFNAPEFPTISFKSTKVVKSSGDKLSVSGDLSLHGVTKPITIEMTYTAGKQTPMGFRSGVESKFTIKRSDYKMNTYIDNGGLGDDVELIVAVEGIKP